MHLHLKGSIVLPYKNFFATYMVSRYTHEKTNAEIQTYKAKEIEEKYRKLSMIN